MGLWCSGITSASQAEGPGFNPRRIHIFVFSVVDSRVRARIINAGMIESDSFGQQDEVSSRYKRLDKIGKGTYGVVYLALDLKTSEEVALKKMIFHVAVD